MKTQFAYFKGRKKVDFGNSTYNQVQDLCFELFGDRAVIPDLGNSRISIFWPISLTISFSENETRMYFYSYFDPLEDESVSIGFEMCQSSFSVFEYAEAERYLSFKKAEAELISQISG